MQEIMVRLPLENGGRMSKSAPSTDRRVRRMNAWAAAKADHGRQGWKARKKKIKRMLRDSRRFDRTMQNSLIDNALLRKAA